MTAPENRVLALSVMPDQTLLFEWEKLKSKISPALKKYQNQITKKIIADPEKQLFLLGFYTPPPQGSPSLTYFAGFARCFVQALSKLSELETLRHDARVEICPEELDSFVAARPAMAGAEYVTGQMLKSLWQKFHGQFSRAVLAFDGRISDFFHGLNPDFHLAGRVFFHLVENRNQTMPFAFMATYSAGMGANGKLRHLPLKHAIESHSDEDLLSLLSTVYRAGEKSLLVSDLINSGELFHPLAWNKEEAFCFLKEIPDYEEAGVICRIPDWWKQSSKPARINISLGDKKPAMAGLDALLDFQVGVTLGEIEFTREEIQRILEETQGLAFIKNRWVAVDPDKLKQALRACERLEEMELTGLTLKEAMRNGLNPDKMVDTGSDDVAVSVSHGSWLESVMEQMKQPGRVKAVAVSKGFKAQLRPYQAQGLNWLNFLNSHGFGACLADDMGLGKTVQILALLSTFSRKKSLKPSLLVVPASLISNWTAEIETFVPSLKVHVAHPGFAPANGKQARHPASSELDRMDLVITSYTLAKKYDWLKEYTWNCLILDEAQAIKNPGTKQTRAVKELPCAHRIAMTGTPVENRLSDLWSLFDFLNPGLLGNKTEFSTFAKTLKTDPEGYARLRRLISPYILRRLKTDKTVIHDLPDKVEMKTFSDLSKKQVLLYQKSVKDLAKQIKETEGIQRKGLVLSALMRFKQLCNHPDQLTGTGEFKESHSGKFSRLGQICETIYQKRERVLVFTQFKEMTEPLRAFLETIFHDPGLVLHGSVSVAKRKALVDQFQDEPYCPFMVLSLKAGGVGLNLTRANHVIHFDRWWNPAVENQATDRAFRIGQTKKVIVHKFVTRGTIEEKIDKMITEKQDLADQVVAQSSESLITEMDDQNLMDLFKLSLPV